MEIVINSCFVMCKCRKRRCNRSSKWFFVNFIHKSMCGTIVYLKGKLCIRINCYWLFYYEYQYLSQLKSRNPGSLNSYQFIKIKGKFEHIAFGALFLWRSHLRRQHRKVLPSTAVTETNILLHKPCRYLSLSKFTPLSIISPADIRRPISNQYVQFG